MPASKPTDWDALWDRYRELMPQIHRGFAYWRSQPGNPKHWNGWQRALKKRDVLDRDLGLAIQTRHRDDIAWLARALSDDDRKWMVARACKRGKNVPKRLFEPMLRAAVYERNPSRNRAFVDLGLKAFGHRRVIVRLLAYIEVGSEFEMAGAVNALYWSRRATGCADLGPRVHETFLREFVRNDDVDVRRSLIGQLELRNPQVYSESSRPLVKQAITIAENSPDEYIRHRVKTQLGARPPYQPLPPRGTPAVETGPLRRAVRTLLAAFRLRSLW
ncbi:MAG: hypothetical protein O7F76_07430 [Planctomycetota bacterium]|nr:hypothetical protein [Planctomycetota bacterium]